MLNYRWINNRKTFGRKRSQTYLCRPEKWMPKGLFRGNGSVVQLVRMPPCHGGGRGFESRPVRKMKSSPRLYFKKSKQNCPVRVSRAFFID